MRRGLGAVSAPDDGDPLLNCSSVQELWLALLLQDTWADMSDVQPAADCLVRHHSAGEPGARRTALLLLTARRWQRHTARLIARLLASGVLSDEQLDELADSALYDDHAVFTLPKSMFNGRACSCLDVLRCRTVNGSLPVPAARERRLGCRVPTAL